MIRRVHFAVVLLAWLLPVVARADGPLTVVNVHAWDCPPCLRWQNTYKKDWENSREFKLVRYVEIDSPTIRQAYAERYWPDDLKPLLKTVNRGVPRFLIVKDGRILSNYFGVDHWSNVLADLNRFLAVAPQPAMANTAAASATGSKRYDGAWSVTHVCPDQKEAKGYTLRYTMTVTNGAVMAQRGTEGKPDFSTLTGQIMPDGTAALTVKGLTGSAQFNLGNAQEGVPYGYPVSARFDSTRGTGERTKDRPCTLTFVKI
jgi:hypothetical protein